MEYQYPTLEEIAAFKEGDWALPIKDASGQYGVEVYYCFLKDGKWYVIDTDEDDEVYERGYAIEAAGMSPSDVRGWMKQLMAVEEEMFALYQLLMSNVDKNMENARNLHCLNLQCEAVEKRYR